MQLRAALGFLRQYMEARPKEYVSDSLTDGAALNLAVTLGERELALELINAIRTSSLSSADDYSAIIQANWRTGEYEAGYEIAMEGVSKFPNAENMLYQAHRFLLWGGYYDDARAVAARITGTELPQANLLMMRIRQACADGKDAEAKRIYEVEFKDFVFAGIGGAWSTDWIILHTLNRPAEANEILRPLDQENLLFPLSAYLDYPFFDVTAFPVMQRTLEREQIVRPPYRPIPFACGD